MPRHPDRGQRDDDRAARGDADAPGLPGNGGRTLTHSERIWLLGQMASPRKRPVDPLRPRGAIGPVPPRLPADVVARPERVETQLAETERGAGGAPATASTADLETARGEYRRVFVCAAISSDPPDEELGP